jgi:hypothetical protein
LYTIFFFLALLVAARSRSKLTGNNSSPCLSRSFVLFARARGLYLQNEAREQEDFFSSFLFSFLKKKASLFHHPRLNLSSGAELCFRIYYYILVIIMASILRASRRLLGVNSNSLSCNGLPGCESRFSLVLGRGGERSIATTTKTNAGMGSPTGTAPPPTEPLEEEHELIWDAGDKHPETALDNLPEKIVGKYEALGMLVGALCFMGGVYTFAGYYDKAASRPFVERDMEKRLKKELGGR